MKAPLLNIRTLNLTVNILEAEAPVVSSDIIGVRSMQPDACATSACQTITRPAIGEYWAGQGGIYGGRREYPEGLCYVIFAATDVGKHAYGEHGTNVEATSNIDGRENTAVMVNRDGSHPAADASYAYTCDGHNDFYLPSSGELHHGYLYLPEAFEKGWYISSTQRSAYHAFTMTFAVGHQGYGVKLSELRVRPSAESFANSIIHLLLLRLRPHWSSA